MKSIQNDGAQFVKNYIMVILVLVMTSHYILQLYNIILQTTGVDISVKSIRIRDSEDTVVS